MQLDAHHVALQLIRSLREPIRRIRARDAGLADQLVRAVRAVPLNICEGSGRTGNDRRHYRRIAQTPAGVVMAWIALGSAEETRACLQVAEAFGYLDAAAIADPLELLERELAMLWRLTR